MTDRLKRALKGAVYSVALCGLSLPAHAQLNAAQQQAVDAQTGIASPSRAEERLLGEEARPRVQADVKVRHLELGAPPEGADKIVFELSGITLEGVTVYTPQELENVYRDRLGTTISLAELYEIAAELTRKYRNDGFVLTQVVVPPQTIEAGVARLRVVEGRINNIEVRGEEGSALRLIRDYAARIKKHGAMNAKDLERALLLINDLPGVTARSVLNPSPDTVGATDLLIIVERKSYDAQISIDNHGTRYLGPVQASAALSLNSWFDNNERLTAQFVMAAGSDEFTELMFGELSYFQPLNPSGTSMEFLFSHTHTEPGYTLDQFNVKGWSTTISGGVTHPFIRTRSTNLSGRAKFEFKDTKSQNDIPIDPTREDNIRAMRLGGSYEFVDDLIGFAYNLFDLQASQGFDLFGASSKRNPAKSRPDADPVFSKLNVEYQRLQSLAPQFNLLLGFSGQWSDGPLLSAEEFGLGGMNYGRGYDPSEVIGDEGIAGKIEVQWQEPIDLTLLDTYQLYGFYDAGRVWNDDPTAALDKKETLTSTGVGIRMNFTPETRAGLLLAFPLNNTPQTTGDRDPRLFVNVNHRF